MRSLALLCALCGLAVAEPAPKPLATRNALTKLLCPSSEISSSELARLVDVAEAVAVRDGARGPTPGTITYAGSLERALPKLRGERATRTFVELALAVAPFGGRNAAQLTEGFWPVLLRTQGVSEKEAAPRPDLARELAEVGQWAEGAVERELVHLPPAEQAPARARLYLARGRLSELRALAQKQVAGANADPRWHGWLAAALILDGKIKEAEPFVAAAGASGGEAAEILRRAETAHATDVATTRARAALTAMSLDATHIAAACKRAVDVTSSGARAQMLGDAIVACATLAGDGSAADWPADWMEKAKRLAPAGAPGAAVRASAELRRLSGNGSSRPLQAERVAALGAFRAELGRMTLPATTRDALTLLGFLAASEHPLEWAPESAEERGLLRDIDQKAPCDPVGFPLRAVAVRGDRGKLARFLASTAERCATQPGGHAVVIDAIGLLAQLAWEDPSPLSDPKPIENGVARLAREYPGDAQSIALQADIVALRALAAPTPSVFGLEAALSRYEDAIRHTSSSARSELRQRLESNAAAVSLWLARADKDTARAAQLRDRAGDHLRIALALGEALPVLAVRAAWDLDSGTGATPPSTVLTGVPPSAARSRAACLLARVAEKRHSTDAVKRFTTLAEEHPSDERRLKIPELLVDTTANFGVAVDDKRLRPILELKPALYLVPRCPG